MGRKKNTEIKVLSLGRGKGNSAGMINEYTGRPLYNKQAAKEYGKQNFTEEQRKNFGKRLKNAQNYGVKKGMAIMAKRNGTYKPKSK